MGSYINDVASYEEIGWAGGGGGLQYIDVSRQQLEKGGLNLFYRCHKKLNGFMLVVCVQNMTVKIWNR